MEAGIALKWICCKSLAQKGIAVVHRSQILFARCQVLVACVLAVAGFEAAFWVPACAANPEPEIVQVKLINKAIEQQWKENGITPSPAEGDGKWARRVHLDLIGRIPTLEELSEFIRSKDVGKREKLVKTLLEDGRYTKEFANQYCTDKGEIDWTKLVKFNSAMNE